MTKQEFLNGKEFMYNKSIDTCYFYKGGTICKAYCHKGEIIMRQHHANVKTIGTKYFTYYTFVLGKKVIGKINFLNL